jgi:hypothetical protein
MYSLNEKVKNEIEKCIYNFLNLLLKKQEEAICDGRYKIFTWISASSNCCVTLNLQGNTFKEFHPEYWKESTYSYANFSMSRVFMYSTCLGSIDSTISVAFGIDKKTAILRNFNFIHPLHHLDINNNGFFTLFCDDEISDLINNIYLSPLPETNIIERKAYFLIKKGTVKFGGLTVFSRGLEKLAADLNRIWLDEIESIKYRPNNKEFLLSAIKDQEYVKSQQLTLDLLSSLYYEDFLKNICNEQWQDNSPVIKRYIEYDERFSSNDILSCVKYLKACKLNGNTIDKMIDIHYLPFKELIKFNSSLKDYINIDFLRYLYGEKLPIEIDMTYSLS